MNITKNSSILTIIVFILFSTTPSYGAAKKATPNSMYITTRSGFLYRYNIRTGSELISRLGFNVNSVAACPHDNIYLLGTKGIIYLYRKKMNIVSKIGNTGLPDVSNIVCSGSGKLYASSESGKLYSISRRDASARQIMTLTDELRKGSALAFQTSNSLIALSNDNATKFYKINLLTKKIYKITKLKYDYFWQTQGISYINGTIYSITKSNIYRIDEKSGKDEPWGNFMPSSNVSGLTTAR